MQHCVKMNGLCNILIAMILSLVFFQSALASSEGFWRQQEKNAYGQLEKMLEIVNRADNLPRPKTIRPLGDLVDTLRQAGRFQELGLTDEEGVQLVAAVLARLEGDRGNTPIRPTSEPLTPTIRFPPAGYHAGQEFAPLDAVLMRWPFDWPGQQDAWAQMVAAFNRADTTQIIYVNTVNQMNQSIQYLQSLDIATDLIQWMIQSTDSVWIRDYGPQFVYAGDGPDWAIADFHYYDSRPQDDRNPLRLALAAGVPRINRQSVQRVYAEGGNLNHDGLGCVIYSQRTYLHNPLPAATVDERIRSAFNASKSIVPQDPTLDGTGHVDMFMKIVSPTRVLVAQYQPGQKDYQILENCAQLMLTSTNGANQPWEVIRIPQPDVYYVSFVLPVVRTYTNGLIANSVVIVPVYDISLDADALAIYQNVFPEKTIVPINASDIIESAGAWHCVTMEFPSPASSGLVN